VGATIDFGLMDRELGPPGSRPKGVNTNVSRYLTSIVNTKEKFVALRNLLKPRA
jgi:hypothetical protein